MPMYKPLHESLTIKESGIEGLGLFAKEGIGQGTNLGMTHLKIKDEIFRTPLGGFINHANDANCVKVEFNNDENINQKFITLCSQGDIENITKILSHIDINTCDYDKRSGLHLAAAEGHIETVKLLLEHNANLTKDRLGNTPLSEVANKEGQEYETIKSLLHF